jgi:hypothetical protein
MIGQLTLLAVMLAVIGIMVSAARIAVRAHAKAERRLNTKRRTDELLAWHRLYDDALIETLDYVAALEVADAGRSTSNTGFSLTEVAELREALDRAQALADERGEAVQRLQKIADDRRDFVRVAIPTREVTLQSLGSRGLFPVPVEYEEVVLDQNDLRIAAMQKLERQQKIRLMQNYSIPSVMLGVSDEERDRLVKEWAAGPIR